VSHDEMGWMVQQATAVIERVRENQDNADEVHSKTP